MRNLRNIKHSCFDFGSGSTPLAATTWDPSDDSLICAFGPSLNDPLLSLKRLPKDASNPEEALSIASWDAPSPNPDLEVDEVLNLHCFADAKTIVLVLKGGDIILVREEPEPGQDLIEIIGSVDAGIAAAQWSPDEELLAIATLADTVVFMTREGEGIANVTLSPEDVKVSDHVSVGWGKRETQFQGRGAKALRDPTVPEHVDEGTVRETEDGRVSITWRGDGQFVAINGVITQDPKRRIIRFYSREGVLESVSEPVNYMGNALSWKPSGQLVAGIQHLQDRTDVIFFERNGLRHGEFSLRLSEEQRQTIGDNIELSWNVDSTVLAVVLGNSVQLWTTGNYHWYLKQEIDLHASGNKTRSVSTAWHPEKPLHLTCDDGVQLRSLDFTFDVARGPINPPYDSGLVAVIDGKQLKITPLRTANVPPPMAFEELDLESNAVDVAFEAAGKVMAVLHETKISVWHCDYSAKPMVSASLANTIDLPSSDGLPAPRQLVISPEGHILAACSASNEESTVLALISAGASSAEILRTTATITSLFARSDHQQIICETSDGGISHLNLADGDASLVPTEYMLPTVCSKVEVWHGAEQDVTVGLTASGILHVISDFKPLRIPGCTSFTLAPSHLIYTTSQHLLKFIHLHNGELEVPPNEPEKDERCRNVERGAKLVTVMPSAYSLTLQMPRGNLETIYPRALVLAGIRTSINAKNYKKAFSICRVQRVDMNILHDYAPEQFMQDIELFVMQVKKTEYIDLFLSSLSEENVAETIYKETLRAAVNEPLPNGVGAASVPSGIQAPSKINSISDTFIKVLQKDRAKHLQSIVTAHVCKSPPDLEAGLQLVAELRRQANEEQLDQAVEHICFLADTNRLYDTALGIYELDVALLVAQQSQKDPKEYLPYLQALHDLPSLRQRFAIDNDLRRYRKALGHLHELEEFEELKEYAGKHELHGAAMELYRYDKAKIHELMGLYADFLSSRNRYQDAGIAYDFVQNYAQAYEAYRSASMWRESLASAALAPISDSELATLAQDLAEGQEESKDFAAAATIYIDYLDDLETGLRLLCKSHKFAEAIRLAVQRKRPELISEVVDTGLIESSASMTELLAEMKTQLSAQVPRVRELRQKKAEDPMAFLGEADEADGDVPENLSLAPSEATTSGGTLMTRYTNRSTGTLATNATRKTSKNRRREERKRAKGKKGTVYEEEYLVNSIARLIERLNSTSDDVSSLLEGLMRRAMRERAVAVEAAMSDVVEACKLCMEEVFAAPGEKPVVQDGSAEGASRPWGGQGVHWDALSAAGKRPEAPVLKGFERLSLLR